MNIKFWGIPALLLSVIGCSPDIMKKESLTLFDYNVDETFKYHEIEILSDQGTHILDVSFTSPHGGTVPAYLVLPDGDGPFSAIVWQHGGPEYRTWFLPDAIHLARRGVVSLLLDSPQNRPGWQPKGSAPKGEQLINLLSQVGVDIRRGVDVLSARNDIDANKIGYVGLSFGAVVGLNLAAVDQRFQTFVLVSGVIVTDHYRESNHPAIATIREKMSSEKLNEYLTNISVLDPEGFVKPNQAVPMLFQSARFDLGVPKQHSQAFFDIATGPKELKWYNTGHQINDPQALDDRVNWLCLHLDCG